MITWILDKHVDRARNAPTPFIEEAKARGHTVYGLRDSIIPKAIDLSGITISGPTIVRGSHGFVNYVEKELKPSPGGFLHQFNFNPSVYISAIGDYALNSSFQTVEYGDFIQQPVKKSLFVKPLEEIKKFTGIVLNKGEVLREKHAEVHGKWFEPLYCAKLMISEFKPILKEYRVVVVNKIPITGSTYDCTEMAPDHVMATAQMIAKFWNPADAYVIDIGETEEGNKVIEYNQFFNIGYVCMRPEEEIVDALENLLYRS